MLDRLPDFIDPVLFAERRRVLSGTIKMSEFTRLSEVLMKNEGDVKIDFSFEKMGRLATVRGTIKADLVLECQSCLKGVLWPIDATVNLGVVSTLEQADRLAEEFEPLWMEAETISLKDLVEDEILLALPDFPRHSNECMEHRQKKTEPSATDEDNEQLKSDNPFSVLAQLKNTGD